MNSKDQDQFFEKFDDLVKDEDKIVTCMSVSNDFNVSLQDAKQLIAKYVERQKVDELAVTYLISGILKNGVGLGVYLIKNDDYKKKNDLFENISSELIYNVQKSRNIDYTVIALAEKRGLKENPLLGSIVGKNCIKRSPKEKIKRPVQAQHNVAVEETKTHFAKIQTNGESTSKDAGVKKIPFKGKAGGIKSFFNKAPTKSTNESIQSVFENENGQNTKKSSVEEKKSNVEEKKANVQEKSSNILDSTTKEVNADEAMDVEINEDKSKNKSSQSNQQKTKKRARKEKSKNLPNKRRKRIEEIYDSDSSDMFDNENEDNENVIEASDEECKPVAVVKPLKCKGRRRKAVDKTYQDEDGFIVTQTEYIFETDSEKEVEPEENKKVDKPKLLLEKKHSTTDSENDCNSKSVKGKKNKKPVIGKQSTLMNFITKK